VFQYNYCIAGSVIVEVFGFLCYLSYSLRRIWYWFSEFPVLFYQSINEKFANHCAVLCFLI